jgi:hypothetical protein
MFEMRELARFRNGSCRCPGCLRYFPAGWSAAGKGF